MKALPPLEAELFETITELYHVKDYNKCLEAANTILEKFPDHGETLSMKALILYCLDRKSDAYSIAQEGLKKDAENHACWRVCGLIHQSDRLYENAIKCYQNALKHDPSNLQILRELSIIQAQTQDKSGFVETRQRILELEPKNRTNWICLAVVHHVNSNCLEAVKILEDYEATLPEDYPPDSERQEHGEILLYKVSVIEECGSLFLEKALVELRKSESNIDDKLAFAEQHISLLLKLNRLTEAEQIYRSLISMDPDNYRYYVGLQKCLGLSPEKGQYSSDQVQKLDALYNQFRTQYSCSSAVKRLPLDSFEGKKFKKAAEVYLQTLLSEGVPSLFSSLRPLYQHPSKVKHIEKLIINLENSIKKNGGFPGRGKQPPSTRVWTLLLLAQHYDRCGQYENALAKIDEAIQFNPSATHLYSVKGRKLKHAGDQTGAVALADKASRLNTKGRFLNKKCVKRKLKADKHYGRSDQDEAIQRNPSDTYLYSVKGRILKHAGDLTGAAAVADKATCMKTKDWFLNKKCVKRMLQSDEVSLAEPKFQSFYKPEDDHDNLHLCYEFACGESYFRQGYLEQALEKFLAVEKQCTNMTGNLLDFHSYRSRNITLRRYAEMLKFQDQLCHSYFHKAVAGTIRCYIKLYDSTSKVDEKDSEKLKLLPHQDEKIRQNKRKAKGHAKKVDDPLSEATKYLKLLQKSSSELFETHLLSFEVNMRKKEILLSSQAVMDLQKLEPDSPDTHRCLIRFLHEMYSMAAAVLEGFSGDLPRQQTPLTTLNKIFIDKHKDSLMHIAAAGEMLFFLEPNKKPEVIKLIEDTANRAVAPLKQWKLQDCIDVHKLLAIVLGDSKAARRWKARCRNLFPLSNYFDPSTWLLDSGATRHYATKTSLLYDTIQLKNEDTVTTANGEVTSISVVGSHYLHLSIARGPIIHLPNVRLAPSFHQNAISIPEFVMKTSYVVEFFRDGYLIRSRKYAEPFSTLLASGPIKTVGSDCSYVVLSPSCGTESKSVTWKLDSGAGLHATSDRSILKEVGPCQQGTVVCGDGKRLSYSEAGSFILHVRSGGIRHTLKLSKVCVVQGLNNNLISVRKLAEENSCSILFTAQRYYILNQINGELDRPDLVRVSGKIEAGEYIYVPQLPELMKAWKPVIDQKDNPEEEEEEEEMDDI